MVLVPVWKRGESGTKRPRYAIYGIEIDDIQQPSGHIAVVIVELVKPIRHRLL